jgi:hypothetical protein
MYAYGADCEWLRVWCVFMAVWRLMLNISLKPLKASRVLRLVK